MKHIKQGIVAAVSAGAALATGQAAAEAYYLGASVGQSNVEISESNQYWDGDGYTNENVDFEADDTAFKIFGGYMFNEYLGIEAGYLDLGDLEDSATWTGYYGFDGGETTDLKAQMTGWTVQVVGQYPIGPVDVFAKAGFIDYDLTVETATKPTDCSDCFVSYDDWTDEGNDWIYGIGASWNVGDFGIRAEWENIEQKHESVDDLSVISIGFEYHLMR
jgi:hypothetical protein